MAVEHFYIFKVPGTGLEADTRGLPQGPQGPYQGSPQSGSIGLSV